jgi:hypothetical protein
MQGVKLPDDRIIAALKAAKGLISYAARRLRCTPDTIHRRVKTSQAVAAAVHQARAEILDDAELQLHKAIRLGQPWAVAFALKTIGRDRGYLEKQQLEHTGAAGGAIAHEVAHEVTHVQLTADQRRARISALLAKRQAPCEKQPSAEQPSVGAVDGLAWQLDQVGEQRQIAGVRRPWGQALYRTQVEAAKAKAEAAVKRLVQNEVPAVWGELKTKIDAARRRIEAEAGALVEEWHGLVELKNRVQPRVEIFVHQTMAESVQPTQTAQAAQTAPSPADAAALPPAADAPPPPPSPASPATASCDLSPGPPAPSPARPPDAPPPSPSVGDAAALAPAAAPLAGSAADDTAEHREAEEHRGVAGRKQPRKGWTSVSAR